MYTTGPKCAVHVVCKLSMSSINLSCYYLTAALLLSGAINKLCVTKAVLTHDITIVRLFTQVLNKFGPDSALAAAPH